MPHAERRRVPAAPLTRPVPSPPAQSRVVSGPLTARQLQTLSTYKYAAEDRSILYNYLLNPLYARLVNLLPLWLAPNAVTLLGFFFPVLAHVLLLAANPRLDEAVPPALYLFAGLSLLTYMTLDNLDGKQARRTGSSSPLGHLFDHGCDALNITVSGVSLLAATRLAHPSAAAAALYGPGFLIFYTSTLEELHTGRLVLREFNGATEGLVFLAAVHLTTFFVGPFLWDRPLSSFLPSAATSESSSLLGRFLQSVVPSALAVLPLNRAVASYAPLATLYSTIPSIAAMLAHIRSTRGLGHLAAAALVASQLLPIGLLGAALAAWTTLAEQDVRARPAVVFWLAGLAAYDAITRVMLTRLGRTPFSYAPPGVLVFCASAALSVSIATGTGSAVLGAEAAAAWNSYGAETVLLALAAALGWRTWRVIAQICAFIQIRCLSLKPVDGEALQSKSR